MLALFLLIASHSNHISLCFAWNLFFVLTSRCLMSLFVLSPDSQTDYELQYSESYIGSIHQEATIEGHQYCTSLNRAFQSLTSKNFNNFVLTIGCTAVAIYCKGNVGLNIFDSHARNIYGRSHPQGTCVLLEVSSLNSLVHYFQSIHNNDIFELKGLKLIKFKIVPFFSVIPVKSSM